MKWFIILASAALFVTCDALAAYWAKKESNLALAGMLILSPFGYIFFGILNRRTPLSIASGLVNVAIFLGTICVGVLYFKDNLTFKNCLGIVAAIVAIILLSGEG